MNSIYISKEMIDNDLTIPEGCEPCYAESANSLLVYTKNKSKEGLLVFNVSPYVWKTWYPIYDPVNKFSREYDFTAKTYKELVNQYEEVFNKEAKSQAERIDDGLKYFKGIYSVDNVEVDNEFRIDPQYWLRYSKTKNKWTIYRLEYYTIASIEPKFEMCNQAKIIQELFPLESDYSNYLGLPLVDSMVKVLENKNLIERLKKNLIIQ